MKRAADVGGHYRSGPFGIAGGKGLDQLAMFMGRPFKIAAIIARGGAPYDRLFH